MLCLGRKRSVKFSKERAVSGKWAPDKTLVAGKAFRESEKSNK